MKIKRPVDQPGTTRRISMSFTESTYKALRAAGKKRGYSIAGVARQVIDRAIGVGLLSSSTPPSKVEDLVKLYQSESVVQVYEELRLLMQENIDLLLKELALKDQLIAQKQQRVKEYTETITNQASSIEALLDALREYKANAPDDPRRWPLT